MINYKMLLLVVVSLSAHAGYSQETVKARSAYGRALNIGLGVGGYGGTYGGTMVI